LLEEKVSFDSRDLDKERLTEDELDKLIGERDYKEFLNTRNELYRSRNMKEHPPSRVEAINLMAKEPNLIRRPLLIRGSQIIFGFDQAAYRKLSRS
jgi:arsenate reductase-like glutaredoxin family protein